MSPITQKSIGIDGEVFPDRRGHIRRRVLKGATLWFNQGYSMFECVLRNESDKGARLSFAETFALPDAFWVSVAGGRSRKAVVRWRTMTGVGISFEEEHLAGS